MQRYAALCAELQHLPRAIENALQLEPAIIELAGEFINRQHALFLGRGAQYPVALEGALKLKEISYIHAEAYPAGELKHGPLALVDENMPVVAVAPNGPLLDKLKSNLQEVRARGGRLIVFADGAAGMDDMAQPRRDAARRIRWQLHRSRRIHRAAATACLSRRRAARHRRRPATQPRQVGDRRIAA